MKYAIGYDMGVGSLGWAAIKLDDAGEPLELLDLGARIFSTSRDSETNEPIAAVRRTARGTRRRIDRLKQRRMATLKQLVKHGLMPENMAEQKQLENLNPIIIRAEAASEQVPLQHLGRALFHLQQRRGYESNRLQGSNKDGSNTYKAGERLRNKLSDKNQTLGQHLAMQTSSRFRIADIAKEVDYPMRDIVKAEFAHMWQCQAQFYPDTLTQEAHDAIWHAIFHQRKLKPQPKGKCYFNEKEDRAIIALPTAQHYRILQTIHNIRIVGGAHQHAGIELTAIQKQVIYETLNIKGELKDKDLRKLLKLQETEEINLFRGGVNSKILGHETNIEMRKAYGNGWDKLQLPTQDEIVALLTNDVMEDEEVEAQLINNYGCTQTQIAQMFKAKLSTNTLSYGISILTELVPLMQPLEGNLQLSDALKELNHSPPSFTGEIFDELPYYGEVLGNSCIKFKSSDTNIVKFGRVSNPTVHVALNQLRKVHNDIVEMFGCKPERINIEMVRELKKGNKEIAEINKEIAKNNKQREEWRKQIKAECNIDASDGDLAKMKLWCELDIAPNGRMCIFTGKTIGIKELISSEIEIEHILPRSLTMDDSSANLTVTFAMFNRLKGNKAPEVLFANPVHWGGEKITHEQVISRAESLKASKSWRFAEGAMQVFENKAKKILIKGEMVDTGLEGFAARHLVDTSHIAKLAKQYLAYGCENGANGVISTSGTLTGLLRNSWGWNTLIAEIDKKDRTDHRHHAVDAVVIALTTRSMVQRMAIAAKISEQTGKKLSACVSEIANPWAHYDRNHLQTKVDNVIISHKPDHGTPMQQDVSGNLHTTGGFNNDTYYGLTEEKPSAKDKAIYVVKWKPQDFETIKDVCKIRDKKLCREILEQITILSLEDINKITNDKTIKSAERKKKINQSSRGNSKDFIKNKIIEFCKNSNIRGIRCLEEHTIKTIIGVKQSPQDDKPYKYMKSGSNYCLDIFIEKSGQYAGKWQGEIITVFDINQKYFTPEWKSKDAKLVMRLHKDDMITFDENGKTHICRVQTIPKSGQLTLCYHNCAKLRKGEKELTKRIAPLQKANCRKISVSPAGRVSPPLHTLKPKEQ